MADVIPTLDASGREVFFGPCGQDQELLSSVLCCRQGFVGIDEIVREKVLVKERFGKGRQVALKCGGGHSLDLPRYQRAVLLLVWWSGRVVRKEKDFLKNVE